MKMKRFGAMLLLVGLLAACNNDGEVTEGELDSLGNKIERGAEQAWDSTKETYKDVRDEVREELNENDSADRVEDTTDNRN